LQVQTSKTTEEDLEMEYSIVGRQQDISAEGVIFDKGSVYDRLHRLTDLRKAKGKRYSLVTVLIIVVLAKLCGADTPTEIGEWGENHKEAVLQLLKLKRASMPEQSTYRRIMAYKVYMTEVERLVGEYNQQGEQGKIYAMDGKAMRGMHQTGEAGWDYLLSVYDVEQGKTVAQVEIGRKENEITKAPEALKLAEISQKVVTGDAIHTQKQASRQIVDDQGDFVFPVKVNQARLYQNIQALFAPEYPKPGFGKIQTDFLTAQKVNKGHGRIETRTIMTSEMLNAYSGWPGLAQVYRLQRDFQWWRQGTCYRTSCEVEFGITSLTRAEASPQRLLEIRRAHWGIETGSHYRRDVTLKEDATHMTIGNTAKIMACINTLVLALIRHANFHNAAQARRWFAAHIPQAFALLVTPFS
jgi:predicted transposase YbfD/YdcC